MTALVIPPVRATYFSFQSMASSPHSGRGNQLCFRENEATLPARPRRAPSSRDAGRSLAAAIATKTVP